MRLRVQMFINTEQRDLCIARMAALSHCAYAFSSFDLYSNHRSDAPPPADLRNSRRRTPPPSVVDTRSAAILLPAVDQVLKACRTSSRGRLFAFQNIVLCLCHLYQCRGRARSRRSLRKSSLAQVVLRMNCTTSGSLWRCGVDKNRDCNVDRQRNEADVDAE